MLVKFSKINDAGLVVDYREDAEESHATKSFAWKIGPEWVSSNNSSISVASHLLLVVEDVFVLFVLVVAFEVQLGKKLRAWETVDFSPLISMDFGTNPSSTSVEQRYC